MAQPGMTAPLAESILALDFPEADAARIQDLNVKANEGTLTAEEEAELEVYINISDLLAYWQSKARQEPAAQNLADDFFRLRAFMRIQIFVTGGTFDKECNEFSGELFFKQTHLPDML